MTIYKICNYNVHRQSVIHRNVFLLTYPSLGEDVGHHPPKGEALIGELVTGAATPAVAALPAGRLRVAEAPAAGTQVPGARMAGGRVPRPPLPRRELGFVNRFIPNSRFVYGFGLKLVGEEISWGEDLGMDWAYLDLELGSFCTAATSWRARGTSWRARARETLHAGIGGLRLARGRWRAGEAGGISAAAAWRTGSVDSTFPSLNAETGGVFQPRTNRRLGV